MYHERMGVDENFEEEEEEGNNNTQINAKMVDARAKQIIADKDRMIENLQRRLEQRDEEAREEAKVVVAAPKKKVEGGKTDYEMADIMASLGR